MESGGPISVEAGYPDLLRMGHRFETSIGQRLVVDGFYGAMDFAFGGDGWFYALNRYHSTSGTRFPRVRFAVCNIDDEFPRNIEPLIDGKPQVSGSALYESPVFCDSDLQGSLFFTDERANKVVTMTTDSGDVTAAWGETGDGHGELNAPSGISYLKDDTLWVVSSRSARVQQFTRSGEYICGFGENGSEPGQMSFPWGVAVDRLSVTMLGLVTFVALLVQVYSLEYMRGQPRFGWYFAAHALFAAAMLALVLADNLLFLYIAWELVGLGSYLLIGFWYERRSAAEAAKKVILQTDLYLGQGRRHEPYEEAIRDVLLTSNRGFFMFEDITGAPWIEIDFAVDIERANAEVLPQIVAAERSRPTLMPIILDISRREPLRL